MLGALGLYWIISNTFLGRYYLREKRLALQDMYNKVNEAASEDEIDTEDFDQLLQRSADKENISLILMDAESATVKLHASDGSRIQNRMWDNLFDATPDIDDIDLIPSRYYIVDTLVEEEHYRISIIYDSRIGMKMLELFGVLDDGCFCLMQTALESIENSSAIASRFMGYIGIVISLAGAVFALLLAGRITEPIRELTEISARMKKLDFSAKYEGSSKTEIAELGDNINELSEILEKTISELKTANAELREDLEKREELEEMRQEFLSNVTHELKTPLALIRGYAEGLADGVADDPVDIAAERFVPHFQRGNIDGDPAHRAAGLRQVADGFACFMQDDLGQRMDVAEFLRQANKLVRENHPRILQLQAHQGFRRVVAACGDVVDRLKPGEHPRIVHVLLLVDIRKLRQDVHIPVVNVDVIRRHAVHRVDFHLPVNAADQAGIVVLRADLVDGFADDDFVVVL